MKRLFLFLLLISTGLLEAQIPFKVIGYLPSYRFNWLNDIEFERLTHVNISFANPDSSGNLSVSGVNITNAVNKAHAKGCKVFISLAGGYLTPSQEAAWNYLAQPANRPGFIQKIVQYVQSKGLDGVDIDLEWQYVESWYSPFILELKAALAPLNIPLTAALPGSYRYPQISNQALAAFDWINMMVYDLTGPFAPNNPGQHSPYWWAEDCIVYWVNQNVPPDKLTLGVPFYGYDFGESPVEGYSYRYIVSLDPANADQDQFDEVFYNGRNTIAAKTQLALTSLGGIMIWEIGQDAFGANIEYSLLRVIDEELGVVTGTEDVFAERVRIFPNPVSTRLQVQWSEDAEVIISVQDMQGRGLIREMRQGRFAELSVEALPAGMYSVAVQKNQTIVVQKFIKT
jgi:chitinase